MSRLRTNISLHFTAELCVLADRMRTCTANNAPAQDHETMLLLSTATDLLDRLLKASPHVSAEMVDMAANCVPVLLQALAELVARALTAKTLWDMTPRSALYIKVSEVANRLAGVPAWKPLVTQPVTCQGNVRTTLPDCLAAVQTIASSFLASPAPPVAAPPGTRPAELRSRMYRCSHVGQQLACTHSHLQKALTTDLTKQNTSEALQDEIKSAAPSVPSGAQLLLQSCLASQAAKVPTTQPTVAIQGPHGTVMHALNGPPAGAVQLVSPHISKSNPAASGHAPPSARADAIAGFGSPVAPKPVATHVVTTISPAVSKVPEQRDSFSFTVPPSGHQASSSRADVAPTPRPPTTPKPSVAAATHNARDADLSSVQVVRDAPSSAAAETPQQPTSPPDTDVSRAVSGEVRRQALLIGCNYPGTKAALKGCVNDAKNMKTLLETCMGFKSADITLMIDTEPVSDSLKPTGKNIKAKLKEMVSNAGPNDILVFHFSGHGTQVPSHDVDDHEPDGLDEAICPTDMNIILDDDLKAMVAPLAAKPGVKMTVVMDCCHSGSMLDGTTVIISGAKSKDGPTQDTGAVAGMQNMLAGLGAKSLGSTGASMLGSSLSSTSSGPVLSHAGGDEVVSRSLPFADLCSLMPGADAGVTARNFHAHSVKSFGANASTRSQQASRGFFGNMMNGVMQGINSVLGVPQPPPHANPGPKPPGGPKPPTGNAGPKPPAAGPKPPAPPAPPAPPSSSGGGSILSAVANAAGNVLVGAVTAAAGSVMSSILTGPVPAPASTPSTSPQPPTPTPTPAACPTPASAPTTPAPSTPEPAAPTSTSVAILITGCQSGETSADVVPNKDASKACGALTNALYTLVMDNWKLTPDRPLSNKALVQGIRDKLAKSGYTQNPCLECAAKHADTPFVIVK